MLVAPSLIPTLWNIGILHHKETKLRKDMQHSVKDLNVVCSTYIVSIYNFG